MFKKKEEEIKALIEALKTSKESLLWEKDYINKKLEWYMEALEICQEENVKLKNIITYLETRAKRG